MGGWLTPRPRRFTPRKETLYPFYRRLGGSQGRYGRVRKISPLPEFDLRTVYPVAKSVIVSVITNNINWLVFKMGK